MWTRSATALEVSHGRPAVGEVVLRYVAWKRHSTMVDVIWLPTHIDRIEFRLYAGREGKLVVEWQGNSGRLTGRWALAKLAITTHLWLFAIGGLQHVTAWAEKALSCMKRLLLQIIAFTLVIAESRAEDAGVPFLQPAAAKLERTFADRLGAHEPIYFIYGPDAPVAKFQFSFKYKILRFGEPSAQNIPSTLQFAFSQRSLWDMSASSSPFYDTSYMPELFYESLAPVPAATGGFTWLGYQAGYKHESNGREGPVSRSLNTVFARPAFAFGALDGWRLVVAPTIFAYIGGLSDNNDLTDYRGYGLLRLILGKNTGPSIMYTGNVGRHWNHLTTQLDLTVPVRTHLLDFETYLLVQYFNGYGESLLSYREKSETVRAGFSFVR